MNFTLGLSDTTWGFIMIVTCLLWLVPIPQNIANEKYGFVAIDISFAIMSAVLATMSFMS
jgi:hypothetical protein